MENDITIDELKKLMKEGGLEMYPKNIRWVGDDGTHYSCWEISKGVFTGDAGAASFQKNLLEKGNDIINDSM